MPMRAPSLAATSSLAAVSLAIALAFAPSAKAESYRQAFPWPRDAVYAAALEALPGLGLKVRGQDPVLARIAAHAGMSAFSIGEDLTIGVTEDGPAKSTLELDGQTGATALNAFARGRVMGHFNRLVAAISARLQAPGSSGP